jgi:hypothetical protein
MTYFGLSTQTFHHIEDTAEEIQSMREESLSALSLTQLGAIIEDNATAKEDTEYKAIRKEMIDLIIQNGWDQL